jgi:hypothetical protein
MNDEKKNNKINLDDIADTDNDTSDYGVEGKSDISMDEKSHNVEFDNDPEVDKAVDKIVNEESDELMASQDKERENQFAPPKVKKSFFDKVKALYHTWWNNKLVRNLTLVILGLLFVLLIFLPFTRYGILNLAGVRVESSLTVVDSNTGLPLKNIPVTLQDKLLRSDDEGKVVFSGLKLGRSKLVIDKIGYAKYEKNLTLGWGSNPYGPQPLIATGTQFSFVLSDWLSEKVIIEAKAASGEDFAQADDEGKIILTVGELEDNTKVVLSADGYRDEEINLSDVKTENYQVKMVPAKKHVFVSNRNGQYDLYKIFVDGSGEEILLSASGKEREVPYVVPHQTLNKVAYLSSREGEINKDGYILDGLFIVDVESGELKKIARSEQLQIIGWSSDKLIYVAVVEGVSAGNSQRSRVFSYDVNDGEKIELAASNYFNDVKLMNNDVVYYAVSSYAVPQSVAKLYTVKPDGSERVKLIDTQVWSIIRSDYETVYFNAIDLQWFEQKIGQGASKLDQPPVNYQSRYYELSPNKEQAVWVDVRDGKGVLLKYDIPTKKDEIIYSKAGLSVPVYWLTDNYVVFRVTTSEETSDYVLNLEGGDPRKISDVLGNRSRYFY